MVWNWSKTAAANATIEPTINLREGQSPGSLNDASRGMMAAVANYRDDTAGLLTTSGTSSAYTVSTNENFNPVGAGGAALFDGLTLTLRLHVTNALGSTLNVDSTGNIPMRMLTGVAIPAGIGIAGTPYRFTYLGGEWILHGSQANPFNIPIGGFLDYSSLTVPNSNFVLPYGQAISRTTYAVYFAMVGTTFGVGDGSTTFNIIDVRGRTFAGLDNMGGVAAGRVTSANSGFDGTVLGAAGGAEVVTLARSALPNVSPTVTVTDLGHGHNTHNNWTQEFPAGASGARNTLETNTSVDGTTTNNPVTVLTATTGISATLQSLNGNVTQTAVNKMQPTIMMPKLLRVI